MTDVRLVPFSREHAAGVVDVIASVFAEYAMTFDPADYDADLQDIEASYLARGGIFAVLLDTGRVVGTVAALPHGPTDSEIKRLYLLPAYRGRGHGRRLLQHVLEWARERGHRRAVAWSDVRLQTAHEVYRRMGFATIGERVCDDIDRSCEIGFQLDVGGPDAAPRTPPPPGDARA